MLVSVCPSLVFVFIDVEAEGIDAEPQLCALLVFDLKVVDAVHLQVLGDFEIFHHGVLSRDEENTTEIVIQILLDNISNIYSMKHMNTVSNSQAPCSVLDNTSTS